MEHGVQSAHVGVHERFENARHDRPGKKMRQIDDGLYRLGGGLVLHFRDHDRQNDRHGKDEHYLHDADKQGIAENTHEIGIRGKQLFELRKAAPRRHEDRLYGGVVFGEVDFFLKRHDQPRHGYIAEYKSENDGGQRKRQQAPVPFESAFKRHSFRHHFTYASFESLYHARTSSIASCVPAAIHPALMLSTVTDESEPYISLVISALK